ncbi:MAG: hypothetical protein EOO20_04695 [Chryseobacterium sp.]|nr:MAG: hypothetical protein EOO20_04695 [Chryseobacterium sp.]
MKILSVKQLKPIQTSEGAFVFPMGIHTKIELDTKSPSAKKCHQLTYQSDLRHYGNVGDYCSYLNNDQLLALEAKGMIEIKKAAKSKKEVGDRVVVKCKFFSPFNDLEGVIEATDEYSTNLIVRLDGVENRQIFESKELKLI